MLLFSMLPEVGIPDLCALLSSFCGLGYRIVHMYLFKAHYIIPFKRPFVLPNGSILLDSAKVTLTSSFKRALVLPLKFRWTK